MREDSLHLQKRRSMKLYVLLNEMGEVKTGALIVIEQNVALGEYVRTGISIDGLVTSQLLINIFEHNTPLHDGAVIIRGNRIVSATCYLPLTDSMDIGKRTRNKTQSCGGNQRSLR